MARVGIGVASVGLADLGLPGVDIGIASVSLAGVCGSHDWQGLA
jgi:hypothetical protein